MISLIWCLLFAVSLGTDTSTSGGGEPSGPPPATVSPAEAQSVVPQASPQAQSSSSALAQAVNNEAYDFVSNKLDREWNVREGLQRIRTLQASVDHLTQTDAALQQQVANDKRHFTEELAELLRKYSRNTDALRFLYPMGKKVEKIFELKDVNVPDLPQVPDKAEPSPEAPGVEQIQNNGPDNNASPVNGDASVEPGNGATPSQTGPSGDSTTPDGGPPGVDATSEGGPPGADATSESGPPGEGTTPEGGPPASQDSPATEGGPPTDGDVPTDKSSENSLAKAQANKAEQALKKIEEEGRAALKNAAPSPKKIDVNSKEDLMVDSALSAYTAKETSVKSPNEFEVASQASSCGSSYFTYFALMALSFNAGGVAMWAYNKYAVDEMKLPLL